MIARVVSAAWVICDPHAARAAVVYALIAERSEHRRPTQTRSAAGDGVGDSR